MDRQEGIAKDQPIEDLLAEIQTFVRANSRPNPITVDQFIAEKRLESAREERDHRD